MDTERTEPSIGRPRKRWLRACVFAFAFLLCGVIIGSSLTFYLAIDRFVESVHNPEDLPERVAGRMRFGLGLNDEQTAEIESIVAKHLDELLKIRDEVHPRVRAELGLMKQDIEATLTPAQAEKFGKRFETFVHTFFPLPPQQH